MRRATAGPWGGGDHGGPGFARACTPRPADCSPGTSAARPSFISRIQLHAPAGAARACGLALPAPLILSPPPQPGPQEPERANRPEASLARPGRAAAQAAASPGGDPAAGACSAVTSAWPLRAARGKAAEPRAPERDPRPAMAGLAPRRAGCPLSAC